MKVMIVMMIVMMDSNDSNAESNDYNEHESDDKDVKDEGNVLILLARVFSTKLVMAVRICWISLGQMSPSMSRMSVWSMCTRTTSSA
jgi:hypothetical protein